MIVESYYHVDEFLLADGTTITGKELYEMQQQHDSRVTFEDELFAGIKQAVGQEIWDFLNSSDRYKRVTVDYENVGPMGGKSVKISAWVENSNGMVPIVMNLYCDHVVYERMKDDLLAAQEFAKSQEDIKKFLTDSDE